MRSVVVVLPASMWAMMPMFLHRSSGTVLDTAFFFSSFCRSCFRTSCSLVTEPVKSLISLLLSQSVLWRRNLLRLRRPPPPTLPAPLPHALLQQASSPLPPPLPPRAVAQRLPHPPPRPRPPRRLPPTPLVLRAPVLPLS